MPTEHRSTPLRTLLAAAILRLASAPAAMADTAGESPSAEHIGRQIKETAQSIGDYSSQKGGEAADSVKSGFTELKSKTSEQWEQVDRTARDKSKEALDEASTQADRLKKGSTDAWGHVKKGFSDAFSSFRKAWDKDEEPK